MRNHRVVSLDHCDLWPRYYFDYEVAKSEIITWLKTRNQFVTDEFVQDKDDIPGNCCGFNYRGGSDATQDLNIIDDY
jgi:hypothetical protein